MQNIYILPSSSNVQKRYAKCMVISLCVFYYTHTSVICDENFSIAVCFASVWVVQNAGECSHD